MYLDHQRQKHLDPSLGLYFSLIDPYKTDSATWLCESLRSRMIQIKLRENSQKQIDIIISAGFFNQFINPHTTRHVRSLSTMLLNWKGRWLGQEEFLELEGLSVCLSPSCFGPTNLTLLELGSFLRLLCSLSLRFHSLGYKVAACLL